MIASGTSDVITATAGLVVAVTAFASAFVVVLQKLRAIHSDTGDINHAVNGKPRGETSIQEQVQHLYDKGPPSPDAGLVLAVHALMAKIEGIERRLDK